MKTILVMDIPAEQGGALKVLDYYYKLASNDKSKKWIFVTSIPKLKETNHIKNIRYPWIKKSWFHRLFFDNFIAPHLCKKYGVDEVFSLQNVIVPRVRIPHTLYVHQLLPFSQHRFSFNENMKYWVYQNVIGRMIINSIRKSNKVIVQTNWVKKVIMDKVNIQEEKIIIHTPNITINKKNDFKMNEENYKTFFYPASADVYKNHGVIIDALLELNSIKYNCKVIFTLNGNENKHISKLYKKVIEEKLPIEFVGSLNHERVLEYYSKSILIFPSYIESLGLPLLEAKTHNTPIISSDMPFSREILDDYDNVNFFTYDNPQQLAKILEYFIA